MRWHHIRINSWGAIDLGDIPGISLDPTPAVPVPPVPVTTVPNPPAPGVDPNMMPPHLRPSAPPVVPGGQVPVQRRELTENERRLMRENGMTEEQWWTLQDLPADKVAIHQFTKPEGA